MEKRKERIIKRIINQSKKLNLPSNFLRLMTFSSIFNNPEKFNKDSIEFQKFMNDKLDYRKYFKLYN